MELEKLNDILSTFYSILIAFVVGEISLGQTSNVIFLNFTLFYRSNLDDAATRTSFKNRIGATNRPRILRANYTFYAAIKAYSINLRPAGVSEIFQAY